MTTTIKINGPIISSDDKWIYDYFEREATCPRDVVDVLPSDGSAIEVNINSGGGLVDSGNEIYTALKAYPGQVIVNVTGMAASAASIIAMAGDTVKISPVAQIMIHNVQNGIIGDYRDMSKNSDLLQQANDALANAYVLKTGLSKEEVLTKMNEETYLNADQAVALGFADEILFTEQQTPQLIASEANNMLPQDVINSIRKQHNQKPAMKVELSAKDLKPIVEQAIDELKATTIVDGKTLNEWDELNNKQKEEAPKTSHVYGSFLI